MGSCAEARADCKVGAAARSAVGLGVAIALYGLVVWSPGALFSNGQPDLAAAAGLVSSIAYGLALLALAACPTRLLLSRRAPTRPALCAALVLSCALWAAVACVPDPSPVLAFAAGACAGAAVAGTSAVWVASLSAAPVRRRRALLLAAASLASVLSFLPAVLPRAAAVPAVLAFLLVEAILLWRPGAAARSPVSNEVGFSTAKSHVVSLLPIVLTACVITFVAPLVNTVLMVDALVLPMRLVMSSSMSLLVAALLAVLWLGLRRNVPASAVLFGYVLLLASMVGLVWVGGLRASMVLLGVGSAGFFLATYIIMDVSLGAARADAPVAFRVYGASAGAMSLARVVADLASQALLAAGMSSEIKTLVTVFLLIYVVTWAAFFLFGALPRRRGDGAEKTAGLAGELAPSSPAAPAPPGAGGGSEDDWSQLAQRCDALAAARGLSKREHEVLALMMRGRNVPAIAEELTLSRNTVQTHVRHVYERLGVHSRQELVALVDAFDE
jgi:DNA-binding CsgD family transcriptional regulator/MFS family permease